MAYRAMGVLPSTEPVATFGSSFITLNVHPFLAAVPLDLESWFPCLGAKDRISTQ